MKSMELRGSWIIHASSERVYTIISDFEAMPLNFPKVAHRLEIIERDGNLLTIAAEAKSFGRIIPVMMKTELLPSRGYICDTVNETLGTSGHEELLLETVPDGTRVDYVYNVQIHRRWLRWIARPLLGWYALGYWKRAVIDRLNEMLTEESAH